MIRNIWLDITNSMSRLSRLQAFANTINIICKSLPTCIKKISTSCTDIAKKRRKSFTENCRKSSILAKLAYLKNPQKEKEKTQKWMEAIPIYQTFWLISKSHAHPSTLKIKANALLV
jgi:hypothetical protein